MAYRPSSHWITRLALLLPVVMLWACTTEPISSVSDFDYEFPDIDDIDLGTELDTSTVEIEYTEVEDDTAYVEAQSSFASDVTAAADSNERPEDMVEASAAAEEVLDEEEEQALGALDEQAEEDADAVIEELSEALDDPNSAESQFAQQLSDAASQQANLAALLGLTAPSGKASTQGVSSTFKVGGPLEVQDSFDTFACSDDAQAALQATLNRLTTARDAGLAAATETYNNSVAKAEAFRERELAKSDEKRRRRTESAREFFVQVRAAITTFASAGLISADEEASMRRLNAMILLVNLDKAASRYRESVAAINAAADDGLAKAEAKRAAQQEQVTDAFEDARQRARQALQRALDRCHDQGQTTN